MRENFPLLVPPLLTLLDDSAHETRIRVLDMLPFFFKAMGHKGLGATGLGDVFYDCIAPFLLSYPSITPLEESMELLPRVYSALFALTDHRYAITNSSTQSLDQEQQHIQKLMLESLFREGILMGWNHCSEIPEIVEILVTQLGILAKRLEEYTVRILKVLQPI